MAQYALGLDFGTNSVRALLVDCADGREVGTGVAPYPGGLDGVVLDPNDHNLARQHPADYPEAARKAVEEALHDLDADVVTQVVGIGVDTTGSTPLPVDENGSALALRDDFRDDLAAMAWLWKDHTSHAEAEEITELARRQGRPYLAKCGGAYSSEWFWSKALRFARTSPEVCRDAYSWIELCDYFVGYLTERGVEVPASVCAAGHKAMYSEEWGGPPARDFVETLDPRLGVLHDRLYKKAYPSDHKAGELTEKRAKEFGLKAGTPVAVGILDAHAGAVGSGVAPGRMVKIIGTSTCDILVGSDVPDIQGVAGIVEGSVIPGLTGIEAGQSAVGDIFAWWSKVCGRPQEDLAREATQLRPGESGLMALDWNNGNRNVLADSLLTGLLIGQTLHTTAAEIYRALIEATAFGALKIIRRIEEFGVEIQEVVACGGIAEKSALTMQIYADVLNRPIRLARSGQAPALGAAIFGAAVGGAHADVPSAQAAMTGFKDLEYRPRAEAVGVYSQLFAIYERLHDDFGEAESAMKELIRVRS